MQVGGFPEPFLAGTEKNARRWRRDRLDRIVQDDIRDLENIRDIRTLELLVDLLKTRVGSLVVIKNLAIVGLTTETYDKDGIRVLPAINNLSQLERPSLLAD